MAFEPLTPGRLKEYLAAMPHAQDGNVLAYYEALAARHGLDLPAILAGAGQWAASLRLTPNQTAASAYGMAKEAMHTALHKLPTPPTPFPYIP